MWKFNYLDLRNYRNKRETMLETIYLALVQDKKSRAFYRQMHAVQFMSTEPPPPPQFSMIFHFKINNSLL